MMSRTRIITGAMAALVLVAICTSSVSAIAPAQAAYSDTLLWADGRVLNYNLEFHNRIGTDKGEYRATVTVDATVKYNIPAVNGDAINITEPISGLTITYPYAINASHKPFVAVYNQTRPSRNLTESKLDFLVDFANEVHGGPS